MKKSLILLAAILSLTLLFTGVSAEEKNYSTEKWEKGYTASIKTLTENGTEYVSAGPVDNAWVSPKIAVLEDIKTLLGSENAVEIVISVDVRAKYKNSANNSFKSQARALLRADLVKQLTTSEEENNSWNDRYVEYCDDNDAEEILFDSVTGNVMFELPNGNTVEFGSEWTHFETMPFYVSKANTSAEFFTNWFFCFDRISMANGDQGNLEFKNFKITVAEVEDEEPEETEKNEVAVTKAPVSATTSKPTAAPESSSSPSSAPQETENNSLLTIICIASAAFVVAVGAVLAIIVIKKKKK